MGPETTIRRIVVGVGRSPSGQHAYRWAATLAAATGADLLAVSAFLPSAAGFSELAVLTERQELEEMDEWAAKIVVAGVSGHHQVVPGDPRMILRNTPVTHGADLVVIGRGGPGGEPGWLHTSSVAEHLAHHTTVPLAVIAPDAPLEVGRIVVGVDGSDNSHAAARWCAEVAGATGAGVTAVAVREPLLEWTPETDAAAWHERAEERIRTDLASDLTSAGVAVTPVAVRGRTPTDGLIEASRHADLLVVGARGAGGFTGLRAGGVALGVLHAARCSVVLVPPDEG